jgi:hypothetical protein
MPQLFTYICQTCKKTSRIVDGDPIPSCCGQLMQRYGDDSPPQQKSDSEGSTQTDSVLK